MPMVYVQGIKTKADPKTFAPVCVMQVVFDVELMQDTPDGVLDSQEVKDRKLGEMLRIAIEQYQNRPQP